MIKWCIQYDNAVNMFFFSFSAGKTYQAIAVADFYKDDWPLLVVTTATARSGWVDHFRKLLPWVPADSIKCLEKSSDYIGDCKVLITSYSLLQKSVDILENKRFGFIILVSKPTSTMEFIINNRTAFNLFQWTRIIEIHNGNKFSYLGWITYYQKRQNHFGSSCNETV